MTENTAEDKTIFICENGTKLKIKPVSAMLVEERGNLVEYPQPPKIHVEEKDRDEPNYSDPNYLKAVQKYDKDVADITLNTYLTFGTEVLELGPDVPALDDPKWSDALNDPELFGAYTLNIPPIGNKSRYPFWLSRIVFINDEITQVMNRITYLGGGVKEDAVTRAMDSFRGYERGGTDKPVAPNRQQRRNRNNPK